MIDFEGKIQDGYVRITVSLDGEQIGWMSLEGVSLEQWDRLRDLGDLQETNDKAVFRVRAVRAAT